MSSVVFLRGVNVGGHRTFRPTTLLPQLAHLDATNIGATGIFVIRKRIGEAQLRAEIARRLPFEAEIMICRGGDITRLVSREFFAGHAARAEVVRFVSILARQPRAIPELPLTVPAGGSWLVKVLAVEDRFVVGVYRRRIEAISCIGKLDKVFGSPLTTRNWNTMTAVAEVLGAGGR